ncbi:14384_t:CDS:1, partial [Racocetra fulgida]
MGSTDTSTGNFIGHLVSRYRIIEESHNQQLKQQQSNDEFQKIAINDS